jgi:ribosomal protein S27E
MAEYFANGSLHYQDGEWRDDNGDVVEIEQVRHGEWIIVDSTEYYIEVKCSICGAKGMFSHPQRKRKRCSECGAYMDGKENHLNKNASLKDKSRCRKCVYEMTCFKDRDFEGTCPSYKRDAPDGGYYG